MRIITGRYGGRRFQVPKGFQLRPTTEQAKEALFSSIQSMCDIDQARVLDLFAGTGAISLEFLSREAAQVVAVDLQKKHTAFIKQCANELDPQAPIVTIKHNVQTFVAKYSDEPFDIIFADPPYDLPWLPELPAMVTSSKLIKPGTLFILEHPAEYHFDEHPAFVKHKSYSAVQFSYFQF